MMLTEAREGEDWSVINQVICNFTGNPSIKMRFRCVRNFLFITTKIQTIFDKKYKEVSRFPSIGHVIYLFLFLQR